MTPPDWFLELLGGLMVACLLFLLARLPGRRKRRPRHSKLRFTPEQQARRAEMEKRSQAHAREVMRPGLLSVVFNRDSVAMGDDATDHQRLLTFEQDLPLSDVLGPGISQVLASISTGQATWLIQLHEPLSPPSAPNPGRVRVSDVAVVAQQWSAPRLLVPDVPLSHLCTATLYAVYLAQQDPAEVYEGLKDRGESTALRPHFGQRATGRQIEALRSLPNPRVQETYTTYQSNPEEIPPERRVMF